jgi:uncharacterized membrane protein YfcA
MDPALLTVVGSFGVGVIGAALGVGGGVFLVPFLALFAGLRPIEAVGISLFCVIGTSVGGASRALRSGQANLPLALTLEPIMLAGAVASAMVAHKLSDAWLLGGFGVLMLFIGGLFLRRGAGEPDAEVDDESPGTFDGVTFDPDGTRTRYRPRRVPALLGLVATTGAASGLFGIGGGVLNVPWLTLVARVPMRAAAATSVLTMSVTGAAAGAVHLSHGTVPVALIGASLLGVMPGGMIGARLRARLPEASLRLGFAGLTFVVAVLTFRRAWELAS